MLNAILKVQCKELSIKSCKPTLRRKLRPTDSEKIHSGHTVIV